MVAQTELLTSHTPPRCIRSHHAIWPRSHRPRPLSCAYACMYRAFSLWLAVPADCAVLGQPRPRRLQFTTCHALTYARTAASDTLLSSGATAATVAMRIPHWLRRLRRS
ncbi:hypothetical protein CC85DRAFT_40661 [Cutaneotrichosporon oleaginosum]|uniref:Uncharacterized protein n=1 Tax=Cutaneotrichosporon oleaginosum TaxID=879819 RepID=A0A0J0XRX7_9TREE|nr:uncharacterized protein CC85DRAFT_40661 [Cutaneotrichosporon oleaginosum]KLT43881.1 hypothetical protein CC85DRAFT_40661 [Cutaneotrichosporon oleaginosum]TXT06379.1 hypothetical protein COLE_05710 [Cutaneotrichosporon oleaginosum]